MYLIAAAVVDDVVVVIVIVIVWCRIMWQATLKHSFESTRSSTSKVFMAGSGFKGSWGEIPPDTPRRSENVRRHSAALRLYPTAQTSCSYLRCSGPRYR